MNNWRFKRSMVAASMFCVLVGSTAWAQQETPAEELESLKRRMFELEATMNTHQRATRSVIRDLFKQARGPDAASKINDYVIFGGAIQVLGFWSEDFEGVSESSIILDTVEFDFEIRVNEWSRAEFIVEYDDGTDLLFPTEDPPGSAGFIDRFNVDEAFFVLGDIDKFPLFLTAGRLVVPFGISTGDPVADVLTISDPLTIEVFETREDVILLGLQTYRGFNTGVYVFNGDTHDGGEDHIEHIGATFGYVRTGYGWSFDIDVDFISSVFDSRFLEFAYRHALEDGARYIPGMAAHIKSNLGPCSFVAEWNGALHDAVFTDDNGVDISIVPSAWQISFGYQFHWDPSMEVIGLQGTYLAISYSESQDLAGIEIGGDGERRGFVPKKRFLFSVGTWPLDGVRLACEFGRDWDYAAAEGGTGNSADVVTAELTYEW